MDVHRRFSCSRQAVPRGFLRARHRGLELCQPQDAGNHNYPPRATPPEYAETRVASGWKSPTGRAPRDASARHASMAWTTNATWLRLTQAHWASRGFIVVGINYPGITLRDLLGVTELIPPPPTDQAGDTRLMHAEMQVPHCPTETAAQISRCAWT